MRFRLRTLLIVLALGPPILAWWGWPAIQFLTHAPSDSEVTVTMLVFDSCDLVPWYPPGTPQASALCKQSAERLPKNP
jgi:hypothetical protein